MKHKQFILIKKIFSKKLEQIEIPNNLFDILEETNSKLIGIRDLYYEDRKIYISMLSQNDKGLTINAYQADVNYDELIFETFFRPMNIGLCITFILVVG